MIANGNDDYATPKVTKLRALSVLRGFHATYPTDFGQSCGLYAMTDLQRLF